MTFPEELHALIVAAAGHSHIILTSLVKVLSLLPTASQQHAGQQVLAEVIFTSVIVECLQISVVDGEGQASAHHRVMLLRLALLLFSLLDTPAHRAVMLRMILPLLCGTMQRCAADETYQLTAGKVLAHIARSAAEELKAMLPLLRDEQRLVLQTAMRAAIIAEQQGGGGGSGGGGSGGSSAYAAQQGQGGSGGGGLKLNMDRYRATNNG